MQQQVRVAGQGTFGAGRRLNTIEVNRLLPLLDQYELRVANALWGEKTYPFRSAYLAAIRKHDGANSLFAVDFVGRADAARLQINRWAAEQTNNRIRDIVSPGAVDADTRLVLTNAVYFKGAWAQPSDAKATANGKLHKAFVETNEKGTEAAAATAVLFPAAEAAAPPKMIPFIPTFRADKPFLFLIRHEASGAILFVGRIANPKS